MNKKFKLEGFNECLSMIEKFKGDGNYELIYFIKDPKTSVKRELTSKELESLMNKINDKSMLKKYLYSFINLFKKLFKIKDNKEYIVYKIKKDYITPNTDYKPNLSHCGELYNSIRYGSLNPLSYTNIRYKENKNE